MSICPLPTSVNVPTTNWPGLPFVLLTLSESVAAVLPGFFKPRIARMDADYRGLYPRKFAQSAVSLL
jgi:hypothetical protein